MFPLEEKRAVLQNRTRIEILAGILGVAQHGALKTHIMYKANLSHRQLEKYLAFLIVNNLLEEVSNPDSGHWYQVTEKGIQFLKDYARLSSHLSVEPPVPGA
jgi:predicted transcriptional regulator